MINYKEIINDWSKCNFSWFKDMKNVQQDPIWHGEGNVQNHTKMVVEKLVDLEEFKQLSKKDKNILFISALSHDIEKRSTTTTEIIDEKERIISPRHAQKGENTIRKFLYKEFDISFEDKEHISKLVRYHGLPLWLFDKDDTVKEVIKVSFLLNTELLYILAKADCLGRICEDKSDILLNIELFKELCIENDCWRKTFTFSSSFERFAYLNKNKPLGYIPYEKPKSKVHVMCGLMGSGKDHYIKNNLKCPIVSLDDLRREKKIKPTDKKGNGQIIQIAKNLAKTYLRNNMEFVFNATNITKDMRGKWINLFLDYDAEIIIHYIEVSYKKLLYQNKNREYPVPEKVIDKMLSKLEPPTILECHDLKLIN